MSALVLLINISQLYNSFILGISNFIILQDDLVSSILTAPTHLTTGAISKILQQELSAEQIGEIQLQILQIKQVLPSEPEKYQMMLSDGVHVWPHCVYFDKEDETGFILEKFCIVAIHSYNLKNACGKPTIIMNGKDLDYQEYWPEKIGKPQLLDLSSG